MEFPPTDHAATCSGYPDCAMQIDRPISETAITKQNASTQFFVSMYLMEKPLSFIHKNVMKTDQPNAVK